MKRGEDIMFDDRTVFKFAGGGENLHNALCKALKITPGHGSKSHVAERLGVRSQRYSRIIARPLCALEPAAQLCMTAGVRIVICDRNVHFFAPGDVIPPSLAV